MSNIIELNTYKTIKYVVDDEEISNKIEVKIEQIKQPIFDCRINMIQPQVYLNGYKCDEYDELIKGFVNSKFALEIVVESFKKELTVRYNKQKKKFKFIK